MNLLNILLLTLIIILIILCAYKILKTCKIENYEGGKFRWDDYKIKMPKDWQLKNMQKDAINKPYKKQKGCICYGGTAAIGENCPSQGTIECTKCNKGFVLRKRCVKDYTRPPARPPARPPGRLPLPVPIKNCAQGMTYRYGKCRPNRCFCRGGFPAIGKDCPKYGEHKCSRC